MNNIEQDRTYELAAMIRTLGDSDEPLNQLIRFHSLTEVYLETLIEKHKNSGKLSKKNRRLPYSRKLDLIEKHNLLENNLITSLRKLTKLRNEYAHNPFSKITPSILEELVEEFPEQLIKARENLPDEHVSVRQVAMVIFIRITTHLWSKNEHEYIFQKFYA